MQVVSLITIARLFPSITLVRAHTPIMCDRPWERVFSMSVRFSSTNSRGWITIWCLTQRRQYMPPSTSITTWWGLVNSFTLRKHNQSQWWAGLRCCSRLVHLSLSTIIWAVGFSKSLQVWTRCNLDECVVAINTSQLGLTKNKACQTWTRPTMASYSRPST